MSQPLLLKTYGNLAPASAALAGKLECIASAGIPVQENPIISLHASLLTISFEGIWFPWEEILDCILAQLDPLQEGRLDIIDIEHWRLTRHIFANGLMTVNSAPLNNILAYSGH